MAFLNTSADFFALDIASNSARVVQLKGGTKHNLSRYAALPVNQKISQSDAPADKQKLMEAVRRLIKESGISSKDVAVNIPAGRSFMTVVDLPKLETKDMGKSVEYQADQFIPISASEAKIDWAILGDSPSGADKSEVLIASVANEYAESRLDLLESLGLNVVAMEPEQLALVRCSGNFRHGLAFNEFGCCISRYTTPH
jgi:type IV pilus assembly protein PilM